MELRCPLLESHWLALTSNRGQEVGRLLAEPRSGDGHSKFFLAKSIDPTGGGSLVLFDSGARCCRMVPSPDFAPRSRIHPAVLRGHCHCAPRAADNEHSLALSSVRSNARVPRRMWCAPAHLLRPRQVALATSSSKLRLVACVPGNQEFTRTDAHGVQPGGSFRLRKRYANPRSVASFAA